MAQPRAAGLLAGLLLALALAGCNGAPPPGPGDGGQGNGDGGGNGNGNGDGASPPPPPPNGAGMAEAEVLALARTFDGARAYALAEAQVLQPCAAADAAPGCTEVRYRIPGTQGNAEVAQLIAGHLEGLGWQVAWDHFTAEIRGEPVPAHNIIAERPARAGDDAAASPADAGDERVLYLAAHYDTRIWSDKDPDPARRDEPVPGANDGASGVAVLLALAEWLDGWATNLTLRMLFFDVEDQGSPPPPGPHTAWIQGSTHHAAQLTDDDVARAFGFVLLDLVGDEDLTLRREGFSAQPPHRALQDDLWGWATKLDHPQFRDDTAGAITDDHLPYQRRGIRAVDVIHLDAGRDVFPATHHTTLDDMAHLSSSSLGAVGETVLAALLAWDSAEGARQRG